MRVRSVSAAGLVVAGDNAKRQRRMSIAQQCRVSMVIQQQLYHLRRYLQHHQHQIIISIIMAANSAAEPAW